MQRQTLWERPKVRVRIPPSALIIVRNKTAACQVLF